MDETVNRGRAAPSQSEVAKPLRRRRRPWGFLLLLAVLAGAGYLLYQRGHTIQPTTRGRNFGQAPQSVGTAAAVKGDMPVILNALGTVLSLDTVSVQAQVSGKLVQVGFKQGQMVKEGDFLAQIDPRPYQASLEQVQATLAKDEAGLAQARADLARYQTLIRQDSISKQQAQDQEYLVRADEAAVKVDQANVDNAKLNLSYARIVSPIDGLAGLLQVDVGNYLQPTSATPIVVLTQLEPISVVFAIPAQSLPEVRARLKGGATLPVTALDQTDSHVLARGTLTATDSQISTSTGTINLKASFPNKEDVLFPNQFVNVRLLVDTQKNVLLVPNPAIQRGAPGTFVWLVKSDGTVSMQPVKIGLSDAQNTVVQSGLSVGQSVVIDGADRLSDGARISIQNGPPAAAAAHATSAAPTRSRRRAGRGAKAGRRGRAPAGQGAARGAAPPQSP